jgi:hypothetical protein
MKLKYLGMDNWDRPVYEDENERLWKDVEPRKDRKPDLCTSVNNEFCGEPDTNMKYMKKYDDIEIEFIPKRVTW